MIQTNENSGDIFKIAFNSRSLNVSVISSLSFCSNLSLKHYLGNMIYSSGFNDRKKSSGLKSS